jgi:hypothetical protein
LGVLASACTTQGEFVGVYGTITLPDGRPAQLYAAQADPSQPDAAQNPLDGGIANVLIYTGDDCKPLYYGGKNTFLKIAPDMSSASLTVKRSRFGRMDFAFTGGGQPVPVTVPAPKACPNSDPNATQQAMVAAGTSATDAWKLGNTTGTSPGMIGVMAWQASYDNLPYDLSLQSSLDRFDGASDSQPAAPPITQALSGTAQPGGRNPQALPSPVAAASRAWVALAHGMRLV